MKKPNTESTLPESVMIFGCGYVGTALARKLNGQGVRVGALTRNVARAGELRELGLAEVLTAELDGAGWKNEIIGNYDAVVNCVSSAGGGLEGYQKSYLEGQRRILEWAETQTIHSYIYTSSTSVYPQDDGALVDEGADTAGAPPTGQVLLESEQLIHTHAGLVAQWYVLRLSGIYGPGRHFLISQLQESGGKIPGRGDYHMNMIHRDDIVGAILTALTGAAPSGIYNISDDEPATKENVLIYLAGQLGFTVPDFDPENIPPRLRRRGGRMPDRKVSNQKAKALLQWKPKYPSYREGYTAILDQL
ncbi:MAG: SDR family oxidoreductase [Opitutales bacterium]